MATPELKALWSKRGGHWYGWFYDDMYRFNVHVIWPVDGQQRADWLKAHFDVEVSPTWDAAASAIELLVNGAKGTHVIAIHEWDQGNPLHIAHLAHECFHVAEQVMSQRRIKFHHGMGHSNEPWAYLIESILWRCLKTMAFAPTARGPKTGGTQSRRSTMKKSPPGKGNGKGGKGKKPCLSEA